MSNFSDTLTVSSSHNKCYYSLSYLSSWKCLLLLYCLINLPMILGGNWNQSGPSSCVTQLRQPKEDYFVRYGDPLEILCSTSTHNGANLEFAIGNKYQKSQAVNDTTIRLYVEKPPTQKTMYYCKDKATKDRCVINVCVDIPPQDVHDFQCVSRNLESLECTWTHPRNAYCDIKYNISVYGRAGRSKIDDIKRSGLKRSFKLDFYSGPSYEQHVKPPAENIVFYLTSENGIDHHEQNITIDHFAIVIPEMKNLIVSNITSHNAVLHWNISKGLIYNLGLIENLTCGLDHEIQYLYTFINNSEINYNRTKFNAAWLPPLNETYDLPLDLPLANTEYNVSIYLKCKKGTEKSVQKVTFKTKSEIPLRPPETAPGSFYITGTGDNRTIFIYWKQLEGYEKCGSNFTYNVSITQGSKTKKILAQEQQSMSFVMFNNNSFDMAEGLFVSVKSQNEVGLSKNSSFLYIPSEADMLVGVRSFTSFNDDGTYELSWEYREDKFNITNFTLFWCQANEARKCVNQLGFEIIDARKKSHTKKLDNKKGFQFAISVNSGSRSSGMVWTDCEMSKGTEVSPNLEYLTWTSKDDPCVVSITWKMKCKRFGFIKGYNITLRKITNEENDGFISQFTNDTEANSLIFKGLSYNSIYEISFTTSTIDGSKNEKLDDDKKYNKFIKISNLNEHISLYASTTTFVLSIIFICVLVITCNKIRDMRDIYPVFPFGLEPTDNCLSDHVKNGNVLMYIYNNITDRNCTRIISEDLVRNRSKDYKETFNHSTETKNIYENKNNLEESPILRDRTSDMSTSTYSMPYVLEVTSDDENKKIYRLRVDKSTGYYLPEVNEPNESAQTHKFNAQEQSPLLGDQSIETGPSQNGYTSSSMTKHTSPSYYMIGLTDFSITNDSSDEENGLVRDESTGYYLPNRTQTKASSAKTDSLIEYSAPTQVQELNLDESSSLGDEDVRTELESGFVPNKMSVLTPSYSIAGLRKENSNRQFIDVAPKLHQNITQSPARAKSSAPSVHPCSLGYVSHADVLDYLSSGNDRKVRNLGYKSLDNLFGVLEKPCSTKSLNDLTCPVKSGTPILNKLPDGYCQFSFKP